VLGATSEVQVKGDVHFTGHVIEPQITLYAGAGAFVAADGSQPIRLGEVDFNSGGSGSALTINGSASSSGSQVYLTKLNSCPEGAVIQLNVAAGAPEDSVTDAGITVFNYGVDSDKGSFTCDVRICDAAGANCVDVPNANNAASGRRRRLLASGADVVATFSDTKLVISAVHPEDETTGAATHQAVGSAMLAIGAAMLAMLGARA